VWGSCEFALIASNGNRLSGNEFQAIGPPTEKARRLNVFRRKRGTVRRWRLADRKCCRLATSETGMQQSTRYLGALFWRHRWTVTASLYCTRSGTLSYWHYKNNASRPQNVHSNHCCKRKMAIQDHSKSSILRLVESQWGSKSCCNTMLALFLKLSKL